MTTCRSCGNTVHSPQARICNRCGISLGEGGLAQGALVGGAYRIQRPLGRGGMGAVYLAEDQRALGRTCVVKELLIAELNDPHAIQRFEDEARVLTRMRHPNTPQIYAYIHEGGHMYIAMEHIVGHDLEQSLTRVNDLGHVIRGSRQPVVRTLQDGIEICKILEYMAAQKPPIVHHDVKPANIIRDSESNELFLVDFGSVARPVAGQGALTLYGTPGYAAPENYHGISAPQSDVYALAATLYHLLTDDDPREHPSSFPQLTALPLSVSLALQEGLTGDMQSRPSAQAFRQRLQDVLDDIQGQGRAAHIAPPQLLVFPGREQPETQQQFIQCCLTWWDYALGLLADGRLVTFLQQKGRADLVTWLMLHGDKVPSQDQLLHELLQKMGGPVKPTIAAGTNFISLGRINTHQAVAVPLTVSNTGALGTVEVGDAPLWLQFYPKTVLVRPGQRETINVTVDLDRAPSGPIQGAINLHVYSHDRGQRFGDVRVHLSADSSGAAPSASLTGSMLWMLLSLLGGFAILTVLVLTQPDGWPLWSLAVVGLTTGLMMSQSISLKDPAKMAAVILAGLLGAVLLGTVPHFYTTMTFPDAFSPVLFLTGCVGAMGAGAAVLFLLER